MKFASRSPSGFEATLFALRSRSGMLASSYLVPRLVTSDFFSLNYLGGKTTFNFRRPNPFKVGDSG
jgi:hypothetical protein